MLNGLNHKINVGFTAIGSKEWMGGLNYFKNLFLALKLNENSRINPVVFLDKAQNNSYLINMFSKIVKIKESSCIFNQESFLNQINQKYLECFGKTLPYDYYFRCKNIKVISHSEFRTPNSRLRKINWIPDFQHLHLPEMFSEESLKSRNNHYKILAQYSNIIIVSSNDALKDFQNFAPEYADKARVLHFVSIQDPKIYEENTALKNEIFRKYNLNSKFFYLPNQFWQHKNHKVVFESVNILKRQNIDIQVICTGLLEEPRNQSHIQELKEFIKNNDLENNIKLLGLIDYEEVSFFMRNCISLINPSFFEGWSTIVEEAKSIGKNIILSDLSVHKEQNPPHGIFFNPKNENHLANILKEKWNNSDGGPDYNLEKHAKANLKVRIVEFADTYEKIVLEVLKK